MTYQRPTHDFDAAAMRPEFVCVVVPPEHQGVVNALRAAYPAERPGLPDDMACLLDRLR